MTSLASSQGRRNPSSPPRCRRRFKAAPPSLLSIFSTPPSSVQPSSSPSLFCSAATAPEPVPAPMSHSPAHSRRRPRASLTASHLPTNCPDHEAAPSHTLPVPSHRDAQQEPAPICQLNRRPCYPPPPLLLATHHVTVSAATEKTSRAVPLCSDGKKKRKCSEIEEE
ncbi:hypothetical protein M0R45_025925 [Rubus argutus]|uniref:Uncharacterized protein n=1 Tax=Rubus argutus TaxID=59490 RepID=A0AAW1WVH1_RUBAR